MVKSRRRLAAAFAFGVATALALATGIAMGGGSLVARAACDGPTGRSATLLSDGRVLVVADTYGAATQSQIYDPGKGSWVPAAVNSVGGLGATLLADGRVLLRGYQCGGILTIYDPKMDTSAPVRTMTGERCEWGTATLLRTGKVLLAGRACSRGAPPMAADLYDPATNTWGPAGSMNRPRAGQRALLLADGRVIVVGGYTSGNSAEIYDPAANAWSAAGEMTTNGGGYNSYALSLLGSGVVLAAGGGEDGMPASSAEVFDPAASTWSKIGRMTYARSGASGTLLPDGRVLVLGGLGISGLPVTTGEIFDPRTNGWVLVPALLKTGHLDGTALLLRDGRIFVPGWRDNWSPADAEVYDPKLDGSPPRPSPAATGPGTWSSAPSVNAYVDRGDYELAHNVATLLADGRVFLLKGYGPGATSQGSGSAGDSAAATTPEIYEPGSGRWAPTARPTTIDPRGFTATLLTSGRVLVVGGSAEIYDPTVDRWSPTGPMQINRTGHSAALLADGRVLVAGGSQTGPGQPNSFLAAAEIYDQNSNTWSGAAPMIVAGCDGCRYAATLLRDGRVLEVAGYGADAETYNPKSNAWFPAGSLSESLGQRTATLLPDGRVLVAGGGSHGPDQLVGSHIYDPATNSWSSAAAMLQDRQAHTATLLQNGFVLVAGGYLPGGATASAELYDSASDRWSPTGNMAVARGHQTATLLRNGKVLVVGGYFLGSLRNAEMYTPPPGSVPNPTAGSVPNPTAAPGSAAPPAQAIPSPKVVPAGGSRPLIVFIGRVGLALVIVALVAVAGAVVSVMRARKLKRRKKPVQ